MEKSITGKLIYTLVAVVFILVIGSFITSSKDVYACINSSTPYTLNTTFCMNTSSFVNSSITYYTDGTNVGMSAGEEIILGLAVIVLVISLFFVWSPKKQ